MVYFVTLLAVFHLRSHYSTVLLLILMQRVTGMEELTLNLLRRVLQTKNRMISFQKLLDMDRIPQEIEDG